MKDEDQSANDVLLRKRDVAAKLACSQLSAAARTGYESGGWEWIGPLEAEKASEKVEDGLRRPMVLRASWVREGRRRKKSSM